MTQELKTYRIQRLTAPGAEPITLAEAREHLRADGTTADDDLISAYISAAREHVERFTGRFWSKCTVAIYYSSFPSGLVPAELPFPDVESVDSIKYLDEDYAEQTISSANYSLDADRRLIIPSDDWPDYATNIEVNVTVGADQTASPPAYVPPAIKQAMYLYIGDFYENRTDQVVGTIVGQNKAAEALMYTFRERMGM